MLPDVVPLLQEALLDSEKHDLLSLTGLGSLDLSTHRQPPTPTLSHSSPVLMALRACPQANRVYNPMHLTEASAQKSGDALQRSAHYRPHRGPLLADEKNWRCGPACMLRQE